MGQQKQMKSEDSKVPMRDDVGNRRVARMKRVIEFDAPVLVALEETAKRLQGSGQDISFNTLVELACMAELRRLASLVQFLVTTCYRMSSQPHTPRHIHVL
jgi:hypothetical protein